MEQHEKPCQSLFATNRSGINAKSPYGGFWSACQAAGERPCVLFSSMSDLITTEDILGLLTSFSWTCLPQIHLSICWLLSVRVRSVL